MDFTSGAAKYRQCCSDGTQAAVHHHGYGTFVVDGKMITLKSRMR
jgi:hypothetical protein